MSWNTTPSPAPRNEPQVLRVSPAEALRGLIEADLPAALDRVSAPTLLISGDQDTIVASDQEVLRRGIPDAELVVYQGVGHALHLAHPDRVVADLVSFLERHDTTKQRNQSWNRLQSP